jgi:uncharacterized membrane protein
MNAGWISPLFVLLLGAATLLSCGSRDLKVSEPATFSAIEQYSIQPKCLECHSSLATYQGVLAIVVPYNPDASPFYQQIKSGSMPQQSVGLSTTEIDAIATWIQNGAPNN